MLFGHWFVNKEEMNVWRYIGVAVLTLLFYLGCMAQDTDTSLYLLKVDYAKKLKLDTLPEIAEKIEMYKRNQIFSSFVQSIPVDGNSAQLRAGSEESETAGILKSEGLGIFRRDFSLKTGNQRPGNTDIRIIP